MSKKNLYLILGGLIIFIILVIMAFNARVKTSKSCSVLDARFECQGNLSLVGGSIVFTKVPGGVFSLGNISVEEEANKPLDQKFYKDCRITNPSLLTANRPFKFNCGTKLPNKKYLVHFDITHKSPRSYKAQKGESCLLKTDGFWYCTTKGHFVAQVK